MPSSFMMAARAPAKEETYDTCKDLVFLAVRDVHKSDRRKTSVGVVHLHREDKSKQVLQSC